MKKFELVSFYKWNTPHKIFSDFPNFQSLRKGHVLVVSDLNNETVFEILESKLKELENSIDFQINPLAADDKVISFFLDDSLTTERKALCKTEDNYELLLGGTFKIIIK